jgi:hypothetical protein
VFHDESVIALPRPSWLMLLSLAACNTPVVPPARHANVPPDAVWSGGADGGAWIACKGPVGTEYDCTVFDDFTGDLRAAARFTYVGLGSPPAAQSLDFSGFDGDTIHLKHGRALVSRQKPAATASPPGK